MDITRNIFRLIDNLLYIRKDFLLKGFLNFNGNVMTLGHKVTEKMD
jgi:hypothetical protein